VNKQAIGLHERDYHPENIDVAPENYQRNC